MVSDEEEVSDNVAVASAADVSEDSWSPKDGEGGHPKRGDRSEAEAGGPCASVNCLQIDMRRLKGGSAPFTHRDAAVASANVETGSTVWIFEWRTAMAAWKC